MKYSKKEVEESKNRLREWVPEGSTVRTILRSVSRSGMSRAISVVVITSDGNAWHPNYAVACVLGNSLRRVNGCDAIRMDGCGMDMGFALVYELSHALYGDGYKLKQEWL